MATGRIGVTPTLGTRWSKAPAGGTTALSGLDDSSVSLVYSVGYEQVYRNGVLLSRGNDYTATTGNSITLIDATIAGDIIEVFANELVPLTDAISKGQFTAKGTLLSASAASTPAVLGVGSNDQVLTADSSTATGLKWAAPAAGGMTLINTGGTTLSGASITISSIPSGYNYLTLFVSDYKPATDTAQLIMRFNGDTGNNYKQEAGSGVNMNMNNTEIYLTGEPDNTVANGFIVSDIYNYLSTTAWRITRNNSWVNNPTTTTNGNWQATTGIYKTTGSAITSLLLAPVSGNFTSGTAYLYGVK